VLTSSLVSSLRLRPSLHTSPPPWWRNGDFTRGLESTATGSVGEYRAGDDCDPASSECDTKVSMSPGLLEPDPNSKEVTWANVVATGKR
jgi:hypothetical protein